MSIIKWVSDGFSQLTKPLEDAVYSIPGVKEAAGPRWREEGTNDLSTAALTAVGLGVGGTNGSVIEQAVGKSLIMGFFLKQKIIWKILRKCIC